MSALHLPSMRDDSVRPTNLDLDSLGYPVLALTPDGEITYANAAAQTCLGGCGVGLTLACFAVEQARSFSELQVSGKSQIVTLKNGSRYRALVSSATVGMRVLSLFPDDTAALPTMTDEDELTGLTRRNGLHEYLESALSNGSSAGGTVAVHCIDLDKFKMINDTLGHGIGDLLLRKVAGRIRSACRKDDCVARIGGDEFVVVQSHATDHHDVERLAARLVDLLGRSYVLNGHTINIGASLGVATAAPGQTLRDLLRNGDLALYEAKRAGRGRFRRFEVGMDAALQDRRQLEIDLRRALAFKQFDVHYQPFFDLHANKVVGFEALIRWEHPVRGCVSPAAFIPLAEETGLICKIGEWVLRTACETATAWGEEIVIAVNVSPVQFKSDALVETVNSALTCAGLPAHRLELEITEGALLDNTSDVFKTLNALRDLGVKISMDDFGTGYSSLSYLQKFPFSKIKIDRSFVQGAESGSDNEAILKAVASLGTSLGMLVTAEGVETQEQLSRVRKEYCTHVQGYFTGRPMTADRIASFLSE